jgi:hypothetical protein
MTPEKRKELLHYAADNPDARFVSIKFINDGGCSPAYLETMIKWHGYDDWEIYHEPKDEVSYDFVYIGAYKTKEDIRILTENNPSRIPIKITKSSNGEVKVEIVE